MYIFFTLNFYTLHL